jgi:hypothetical protein
MLQLWTVWMGLFSRGTGPVHDMESKLHQILPVLFQWFDNQPAQLNENDSSSGLFLPHWVLCVKVKRCLHIIPGALFPTGEQLYINSHTSQAGFKEHSVILGMMWCKILSSVYSHSFQFSNPLSHSEFHIEGLVEGWSYYVSTIRWSR